MAGNTAHGLRWAIVLALAAGARACGGQTSGGSSADAGDDGGAGGSIPASGAGGHAARGGSSAGGLGGRGGSAGVGTAGVGGSGTAGVFGTAGGAGQPGTGGTPGTSCGGMECPGFDVLGLVQLAGCCPDTNPSRCGADLTAMNALVPQIPAGCHELNQPGAPDPSCPPTELLLTGVRLVFSGCCRPEGSCGVIADLAIASGLDLGCAYPEIFGTPVDGGRMRCGGG